MMKARVVITGLSVAAMLSGVGVWAAGAAGNKPDGPPGLSKSADVSQSGTRPEGRFTYGPARQPALDMSAEAALGDAWQVDGPRDATSARAFLGHISLQVEQADADAWYVVFDGSCVPVHGPLAVEGSASAQQSCIREPYTVVVDASSGRFLRAFAGGDQPDPAAYLGSG